MSSVHRVNVTLKGHTAQTFLHNLQDIQRKELEQGPVKTSASEYARSLIDQALHPTEPGAKIQDVGISIDSKGARIRLNKTQTEMLRLEKGDRVDLSITKHIA